MKKLFSIAVLPMLLSFTYAQASASIVCKAENDLVVSMNASTLNILVTTNDMRITSPIQYANGSWVSNRDPNLPGATEYDFWVVNTPAQLPAAGQEFSITLIRKGHTNGHVGDDGNWPAGDFQDAPLTQHHCLSN